MIHISVMKLNENQQIIGKKSILIPYESCHVPKYHKWMNDDEIRRLTGSERLSLEEEYEMQKSWREDEDKLTFIILDKEDFEKNKNEEDSMVGDVNLFINRNENSAEVEIMIVEEKSKRKGIASEAVSAIISYAIQKLQISNFFAKITDDNLPSLTLFTKKLNFEQVSHSKVFGEFTLQLPSDKLKDFSEFLTSQGKICVYK